MKNTVYLAVALLIGAIAMPGCGKKKEKDSTKGAKSGQPSGDTLGNTGAAARDLIGVDMAKKVVYVGALNDESGPAAVIGKPFANGKRLVAARINAGGSGLLPEGWKIEMVEKDHGYNPQKSMQHYTAIKNKVLFIATSLGTPNTLPLRKHLERDNMILFPASLSSQMAENEYTPPAGPSYIIEAQRAMDWVVEQAGGTDGIKAGVVYQDDDYGKDGLAGWKASAAIHGVTIVAEKTVTAGQKDVTAVISALRESGATHVLLAVLPTSTGPILATAAQLKYQPTWIGNTPAWIDRFFSPEVLPPQVLGNFYVATGLMYWGEERPGMAEFLETWKTFGKDMGAPSWYTIMSYAGGLVQMDILRATIESGDLSRDGFKKALHSRTAANAGGLVEPLDFSKVPYLVSTRTRVFGLDLENKKFKVVASYAQPLTAPKATAPAAAPKAAAPKAAAPKAAGK